MKIHFALLLAFVYLVHSVHGDGHLACPADRACPLSSAPTSYQTSVTCAEHEISNDVFTTTQDNLLSYVAVDNQYFDRLRSKYLGQNNLNSADSCAEIRDTFPDAVSDWYWISGRRIYCNFDLETPATSENWERLVKLDMSDPSNKCPPGFRESQLPEARGRFCVRPTSSNGCTSWLIPPASKSISQVYGRVYGVQIGTPDITAAADPGDKTIDNAYLDGVSITIGSPRQHVWSFMAYTTELEEGCPCSTGSTNQPLDFIGSDYFCESGTFLSGFVFGGSTVFPDDPLWDGQQCNGLEASCCGQMLNGTSVNSPPWFYKQLPAVHIGENVELHICTDQGPHDESMGLQLAEIYVQ